ncbi:m-AAA protease-interacting protein 1, mitochondrial isoform X1 [Xiphophorus hellerii]|uniref:m-AAA protease-interacting protein 1, mitochondrial isoform X1 n=1 Tax=Xiphophorus hellerii TaxID=8084 RepID=UPI0013B360AE|nr:m-AAA protease-interacting protein 1, mitochondrial isoform X1 [Xiphophorus hellerii]
MVSVLFRCYPRLPSSFTLARFVLNQNLVRSQRCCLVRAGNLPARRTYSSERDQHHPKPKVVVVGIPNPFIWFRTRIYYFLIRTYFDKEFSIDEFTEGAKQVRYKPGDQIWVLAFSHVSRLLSRCQFEALEGLVAKDLIGKLEQKCGSLPCSYQRALCAELEDVMYTTPGDVGIFYDDDGRKFVSILMRFWYLTSVGLPDDSMEGTRMFTVSIGDGETEAKRLLTAIYESVPEGVHQRRRSGLDHHPDRTLQAAGLARVGPVPRTDLFAAPHQEPRGTEPEPP